jgi:hypothetical protein
MRKMEERNKDENRQDHKITEWIKRKRRYGDR